MVQLKMYDAGNAKMLRAKTKPIGRTVTGTAFAKVPRGSRILYFILNGTPSDAGTTATMSIGTTAANANELVSAYDVKTAASGRGPSLLPAAGNNLLGALQVTGDVVLYYKYAESGGASTVGAWNLSVVYTDGETLK